MRIPYRPAYALLLIVDSNNVRRTLVTSKVSDVQALLRSASVDGARPTFNVERFNPYSAVIEGWPEDGDLVDIGPGRPTL
ncbi:hypothetical protein ACIF6L_26700 [Kitasatospora sp. NPDC086009]|uniref:hypothetical protein n=1 Tax=unclassified Kitasatospora TaxID=2633591 RepID=UPI0037C91FA3